MADDTRLTAVLPTLANLRENGARVVLLSHLGRPKGAVAPEFSLAPVAARLAELSAAPIGFLSESVGDTVRDHVARLDPGDVVLLENTRFLPGETDNDPDLSAFWASLATVYVNDAFGTAHRAHASTEGVRAP